MLHVFDNSVIGGGATAHVGLPAPEFEILDIRGRNLLHTAIDANDYELAARFLADAHTSASQPDDYGRTPLINAVVMHRIEIMQLLQRSGKDLAVLHRDVKEKKARSYAVDVETHGILDMIPVPVAVREPDSVRKGTNMKVIG